MNTWNFKLAEFHQEMTVFKANTLDPGLTESEHKDAFARLKKLVTKAKKGQLVFSGTAPEAKVMARADFVIELRPQPEVEYRFGQPHLPSRLVRLYCAEPQLQDGTILGLHLGTKPNADDADNEQNASIDCAETRANAWELNEYRMRLEANSGAGWK